MKQYKEVTIKQKDGEEFNGYPYYRIFDHKTSVQLGVIFYRSNWGYVFSSNNDKIFKSSILNDIIDFMNNEITPTT